LGTRNPHSTAITPTSQKDLTNEEFIPNTKANVILQFFLDLLHVIGGDLNTGKSASFIPFHRWPRGNSSLLRIHHSHPNINILHQYIGVSTVVPRKDKDEPHCELGWMMKIYEK
jgi:hypothetical protein